MERRKALALASTATLLVGSATVTLASVSGASLLGFGVGSSHAATAGATAVDSPPGVVHKTRNIYDRYVLDVGGGSSDTQPTGSPRAAATAVVVPNFAAGNPTDPSAPDESTPTTRPASNHHTHATPKGSNSTISHSTPTTEPAPGTPVTVPPTTTPPTTMPPTTMPPTTTTTWPRGVPRDWPKDKPIPPMPANCREPQLEDNGVWNCDH